MLLTSHALHFLIPRTPPRSSQNLLRRTRLVLTARRCDGCPGRPSHVLKWGALEREREGCTGERERGERVGCTGEARERLVPGRRHAPGSFWLRPPPRVMMLKIPSCSAWLGRLRSSENRAVGADVPGGHPLQEHVSFMVGFPTFWIMQSMCRKACGLLMLLIYCMCKLVVIRILWPSRYYQFGSPC